MNIIRFFFLGTVLLTILSGCENDGEPLTDFNRIDGVPAAVLTTNAIDVVREAILYAQADSALRIPEAAYYLKEGTAFESRLISPDSLPAYNAFFTLTNCMGDDGRMRNGNIQLFASDEWIQDSAFFLFQLSLRVDQETVTGLGRIDFAGLNTDTVLNWNITQCSFNVNEEGVSYGILPSLNLKLAAGDSVAWIDTLGAGKSQQRFLLTGSMPLATSSSNYVVDIDSALAYDALCPYTKGGILHVREPNKALVVVRMNPGCSAVQTYTIGNNREGTIQLK